MKQKRVLTFALVCLMLLIQVPFSAVSAETTYTGTSDIRAELLSPDTLPDGRVEVEYNEEFYYDYSQFNNGFNQYSWSVADGQLPPGLSLYPDSGPTWKPWINGTPTEAGTYTFTIEGGMTKLVNGKSEYIIAARKTYTLKILPAYPLEINMGDLYHGYANQPYSNKFEESRYRTVTWSMELAEGGALPEGLSINATTGDLAWQSPLAGKYNLKITATRGEESVSKVFKLIIEPEGGCKHTNTTKTERKDATCKENGLADYWYCDTCEQYFLDEQYKRQTYSDDLDKLYTIGFHSDKNDDGKCDTCKKAMPIFKKVTNEDEITSGGMYLVVAKIGEKYYTFRGLNNLRSIDAVEITKNSDGTFSYPKSDTDVMILKTDIAAECGNIDAGKPRYSLSTTINGIPYNFSSEDYSGFIDMYSYENSKYGYRIKLTDEKYAEIASVYAEYWGSKESEKGETSENSSILAAFEGRKDGEPKRFFSLRTKEAYESEGIYTGYGTNYFYDEKSLSTYPIELYKLTYTGKAGDKNYTLSDAQSMVTIGNEFTVIDSVESKGVSTVGGISEAVKTSYIENVISNQTQITGNVSARTYANIKVKKEDSTIGEYAWNTSINSLIYEITPMLEIKGDGSTTYTEKIDDKYFDGSEMTLSLCVGNMNPAQIIHHKTDGTKEYFYNEYFKDLKPGQKTFSIGRDYEKGNFVTFAVDSFSDIEILATAKEEPLTVGNAAITAPIAGQTPSFTAVSDDPSRYSVEVLHWIDVENKQDIGLTDLSNIKSPYYNYKFKAGKQYEVVVKFTAADGYELSYTNNFTINGNATNWTLDGLRRTYTFTAEKPSTSTAVNGKSFTVTGNHIDGCTVILALYKDDSKGYSQLVDCKTAVYNGESIQFSTTATDYTSAKVMVWNDLATVAPVTEVEIVNLGQSS